MRLGSLSDQFGPFDGRVWLNAAHQGPLPRPAQAAVTVAAEMKANPHRLADEAFWAVPDRLRLTLARFIDAEPSEIALTNSTSYGINVVAEGLALDEGDEVLVVKGDFPATVLPWLAKPGVQVRFLDGTNGAIDPDRLEAELGPRTRVFCSSWVFSFFGYAIDLAALGAVCRRHGVVFVVNGSQGVGARPLSVKEIPIDALAACGFKWLCGPYATGFCWLAAHLLDRVGHPVPNWLLAQRAAGLNREMGYDLPSEASAARFDVFCTANFLNFMPWTASVDHLLSFGIEAIHAHDQALIDQLVERLPPDYDLVSPRQGSERSTLALLTHRQAERNQTVAARLADAGIDVAMREDKIRIAPHLYNSAADIDAVLDVLTEVA